MQQKMIQKSKADLIQKRAQFPYSNASPVLSSSMACRNLTIEREMEGLANPKSSYFQQQENSPTALDFGQHLLQSQMPDFYTSMSPDNQNEQVRMLNNSPTLTESKRMT